LNTAIDGGRKTGTWEREPGLDLLALQFRDLICRVLVKLPQQLVLFGCHGRPDPFNASGLWEAKGTAAAEWSALSINVVNYQ
jgi:hypothetical protein